jgi:hypothetical protein
MKNTVLYVGLGLLVALAFLTLMWGNGPGPAPVTANTVPLPLPPEKPASPWSITQTTNPVDDSRTTVLQQGYESTGSITVRCGKKLDAYFNTPNDRLLDTDGGYRQNVRVRYGTNAPLRQTWAVADSFDGLFAPSAISFLRSMVEQGTFVIEYRVGGLGNTRSFRSADLGELLEQNCPLYKRAVAQLRVSAGKNVERAASDKRWSNPGPPDPNAGPISDPPPPN